MRGGRELIVTYIFGHMLPQKCNLHFLIYLDKCNLHFWGTIQEKNILKPENCKLHLWGNIRNCNLHFWGVWLCGTDLDAQQFPAHRQHNPACSIFKKKIICPIYTISWVVTYFCRKIPKLWWNLMMCHLAFFLIKSLGRGSHSDQR